MEKIVLGYAVGIDYDYLAKALEFKQMGNLEFKDSLYRSASQSYKKAIESYEKYINQKEVTDADE